MNHLDKMIEKLMDEELLKPENEGKRKGLLDISKQVAEITKLKLDKEKNNIIALSTLSNAGFIPKDLADSVGAEIGITNKMIGNS